MSGYAITRCAAHDQAETLNLVCRLCAESTRQLLDARTRERTVRTHRLGEAIVALCAAIETLWDVDLPFARRAALVEAMRQAVRTLKGDDDAG